MTGRLHVLLLRRQAEAREGPSTTSGLSAASHVWLIWRFARTALGLGYGLVRYDSATGVPFQSDEISTPIGCPSVRRIRDGLLLTLGSAMSMVFA